MAIFDILKRKKIKKEEKKIPKKLVKKLKEKPTEELKPVEKPQEVKKETIAISKRKAVISEAYRILKSPHITEKATDLIKENQYTFRVHSGASKVEIKNTIEGVYGVHVLGVKILNVPPKRRRLGRTTGWRKGYKKAIVKIQKGQKIEVLPR